MSSTATVNIQVTDINDEAPVFSETVAFRVKEVCSQSIACSNGLYYEFGIGGTVIFYNFQYRQINMVWKIVLKYH